MEELLKMIEEQNCELIALAKTDLKGLYVVMTHRPNGYSVHMYDNCLNCLYAGSYELTKDQAKEIFKERLKR